jgi:hypothetical protein
MTAKASSDTFRLKLGKKVFRVKKADVMDKLSSLWYEDILDSGEYEVQTEVPVPVFTTFVNFVKGRQLNLSEENCEFLYLLGEELGYSLLSMKCVSFMKVHWPDGFSKTTGTWFGKPNPDANDFGSGPRVTITVKGKSMVYGALRTYEHVKDFAETLAMTKENGIAIEGIKGHDRMVEKALAIVYSNTLLHLTDGNAKKPFLVFALWYIRRALIECSTDSWLYCLNRLHDVGPTGFDQARLLLLSQCNPKSGDDFVPLRTADLHAVASAMGMLKRQKNGKRAEAKDLLRRLKATGLYEVQLEKWNDSDE